MFDFGLYTQVSDSGPHGPLVDNVLLKFQISVSEICQYLLWEKLLLLFQQKLSVYLVIKS